MAEGNPKAAENVAASHPAPDLEADKTESPPPRGLSPQWMMMAAATAVLYAGTVFASSIFSERALVPRLSTWLALREAESVAAETAAAHLPPFGDIYIIEDLVVNPKGSGGTRYICASVGLESSDPEVAGQIETRDAQIKDCLIGIFSSKSIEDLANVASRESIRVEIESRIEDVLPEPGLDAVYFVNFVLQ